jgi:hypothetical protein
VYRSATWCSKSGRSCPVPPPANRGDSLSCKQIGAVPALEFHLLETRRKEPAEIGCVRRAQQQQRAPERRRQRFLLDRARLGHVPGSVLAVLGRPLGCALGRWQQCLAQGPGTRGRLRADGDGSCRRTSPDRRGCSEEEFRRGCEPEPGARGNWRFRQPSTARASSTARVAASFRLGCRGGRVSPAFTGGTASLGQYPPVLDRKRIPLEQAGLRGMRSRNSSCNQECPEAVSGCVTDGARAGPQSGRFLRQKQSLAARHEARGRQDVTGVPNGFRKNCQGFTGPTRGWSV